MHAIVPFRVKPKLEDPVVHVVCLLHCKSNATSLLILASNQVLVMKEQLA